MMLLSKINKNTYCYKRLTVSFIDNKYTAYVSLPRQGKNNKIYLIEGTSEISFIKMLHRTIEDHMKHEEEVSKRG